MNKKAKILFTCIVLVCFGLSATIFIDKALFWRSQRDEILQWAQKTTPPHTHRSTILFIGDSIIESFPLRAAFSQEFIVINKGVHGNSIKQVADRYISESNMTQHDVVVIEGGINDVLGCVINNRDEIVTYNYIIEAYRKTINVAKKQNRDVLIIELLPVTHKFLLPFSKKIPLPTSFNVTRVNEFVRRINADLRKLCSVEGVYFVETHRTLVGSSGEFNRTFAAADGYHVNVSGYKALSTAIEPDLIKILNATKNTKSQPEEQ